MAGRVRVVGRDTQLEHTIAKSYKGASRVRPVSARRNTWLWWSSGKDSAWALHVLRESEEYDVTSLVTTVNDNAARVAVHAVPVALVRAQSLALGLNLNLVEIPFPCTNSVYESAIARVINRAECAGVTHMAFGDLFLSDIRAYRESLFLSSTIKPIFPLWQLDTHALAHQMIDAGVSAYLSCIDPAVLHPSYAGRRYDRFLLADLPSAVDPCGERGEFHTFVDDAPGFSIAVPIDVGQAVTRDGFVFADMRPATQ